MRYLELPDRMTSDVPVPARAQGVVYPDERTLIARVRSGDAAAFAEVVTRYLDGATRFAFHTVGSHDAAEDVVQAVFVQIWERRETLDVERPFKPYLFRAVRNRALDEQKAAAVRERYRAHVRDDVDAGSASGATPNPEGTILTVIAVQAALCQLSERRQAALRLRLEEQMTYLEIADVLELSPEAAKRMLSRAVAELRAILEVSP